MNVFSKSANPSVSNAVSSPGTSPLTPVDHPSSLRRLCPISDCPLSHLIRPGCEKAAEIKHLPHGCDDLGQRGLCT